MTRALTMRRILPALLLLAVTGGCVVSGNASDAAGEAYFRKAVEPLLQSACYECHSHESDKTRGGLSLDSRSGWETGGESGPAIVPGDPDASLLIQAVRHQHEDIRMPKKQLAPDDVGVLEKWVADGAADPRATNVATTAMAERIAAARSGHWAFQPLQSGPAPETAGAAHPVDGFLRERLAREGLEPSPRADPRTLIRRAYFTLIGLPPSFDEVERFSADPSAAAFAAIVDDLLARRDYGQRWARHWLDVARYADTYESSTDSERRIPFAHTYRDYVVDALNGDKPYDRFILEQLAADLLPGAERPDLRALGLLGIGRSFSSNADAEALRVDDRIDVVGRGVLGLTLACARCHDHKFDAVTIRDYYALYGILSSIETPVDLPETGRPAESPALHEHEKKRAAAIAAYEAHVEACFVSSNQHLRDFTTEYLQYLARQSPAHRDTAGDIPLDTPRGWLVYRAPERWAALLEQSRERDEPFFRLWHELILMPRETFAAKAAAPLAGGLEGHHAAVRIAFAGKAPASMLEVASRYGEIIAGALAKPDESITSLVFGPASPVPPRDRDEIEEDLFRFLNEKSLVNRSDGEQAAKLLSAVRAIEIAGPIDRAQAVRTKSRLEPARVFLRGDIRQPGEEVPRRFLEVLAEEDPTPYEKDGRLPLARTIIDPKNPLTARVIVNRIWQQHFGVGLVATADDFGVTGEAPSHPGLLDHLATRFMEKGWSIKALHRYLMSSEAWQQASHPNPAAMERDPGNRLIWRMSPRQLEFEPLRDALLHVSARLDSREGGRGAPLDPGNRRRALYGYTDRFRIPALLRNFGVANPDTSISRRDRAIVPVQSLFLLNNPFTREQADAVLLTPLVVAEPGEQAKIEAVFRQVLSRRPTPEELALAGEFLAGVTPPTQASEGIAARRERLTAALTEAKREQAAAATALTTALAPTFAGPTRTLANGSIDRDGTQAIEVAEVAVSRGSLLRLEIDPRGAYDHDTTLVDWIIEEIGGEGQIWDLREDALSDFLGANPRSRHAGRPGVWSYWDAGKRVGLLDEATDRAGGREGHQIWQRGGRPPLVFANVSDEAITAHTTLPPRRLFLHPGADGPVAVVWSSPLVGRVRIRGRVEDGHRGAGNGVGWSLVQVEGDYSAVLAAASEAGSKRRAAEQAHAEVMRPDESERRWTSLAQGLLLSNEFTFID